MELSFKYYIDIVVSKEGFELDSKALKDVKNIIKKIHHLNKNDKNLALSFPNYKEGENKTLGNIVRIFSQNESDLIYTIGDVKNTWHLLHLKISTIKEFKITNKTFFYEFIKFHVPRNNNKKPSLKIGYREERKVKADNYPYVVIDSSSTQQKYSLIIEKKKIERENVELCQTIGNSYGLSNALNKIAIPTEE